MLFSTLQTDDFLNKIKEKNYLCLKKLLLYHIFHLNLVV